MIQIFTSLGKQRYFLFGLTLIIIFSLLPVPSHNSVQAANPTYTVNSTGDEPDDNPGDSICHTSAGTCTLRAAIMEANTAPNSVINFNIGANGSTQTISPITAFATITQPVTIDGTSQPGYSSSPLIEINGTNTGAGVNGLTLAGGNSTIKGLIINRFGGYGIELINYGNNVIQGNYIGTDSTGQVALGNTNSGVWVNEVPNNTIGGTTTGAGNIISGNFTYGVQINGNGSTGNRVQGNYIGTDVTGLNSVGNASGGVCICGGSTTTIGGTSAAARNIISGNSNYGILVQYGGAVNNVIQGNYIGLNVTGTGALPNSTGIYISGAGSNTIGGGAAGAGNYISGNTSNGILVSGSEASGTSIQGNYIGLKPDLTALGNGSNGILLGVTPDNSATNTTIGGSLSSQYNTIAYNNGAGIFINSGTGHRVQGNSIFSNQGLGIDLAPAGVNQNDTGDSDTGPNNLQNFPVLDSVNDNSGTTTIQGVLNSTPSTSFNLAFYSNASCDGSGNGEGENYLTTQSVSTNNSGVGTFSVTTSTPDAQHRYITITATDTSGQNTSEFSACNLPVAITTQPVDQYINPNNTATLTVEATGTPNLTYQWYQGTTGNTTTPVGTNSASFTTPPLTTTTSYWVRVTNFAGSEDSQTATVNVSCLYVTQATDTGAGTCGTLSGAINQANSFSDDVTISFVSTVTTVTVSGPLNTLNNTNGKAITINGGCTGGVPQVQINAVSGASPNGLSLGNKVTINGLKITGFSGYALDIQGDNNEVTCNWLGTADGTTANANGGGIQLGTVNSTAANNNNIGLTGQAQSGNVIAGNSGTGLKMNKGSGNQLYYNLVGYNINGDVLSNTGGAISIQAGGNLKFGTGNRIHA